MADWAVKRLNMALEGAFTSGAGSVYNGGSPVLGTRRLAVEESVGADWKPAWSRPLRAGTYAGAYESLLEEIHVQGKLPLAVYPDDLAYLLRLIVGGSPIVTTLPASPVVLLAATAIAATMSLTTQPNAGADGAVSRILAITLANTSPLNTAVNVTIAGTGPTGASYTEVVKFPNGTETNPVLGGGVLTSQTSVTLYTTGYFKTVNASGITTSAQPALDTVAVGGVNAFLWQLQPDLRYSTVYSATLEYDDGAAGWQMPGVVLNKFDFAVTFGKSFKADAGFEAQKKTALAGSAGSYNVTAPAGSRDALQALAENQMAAIATAYGNFYADPKGTAPGTTNVPARVVDYKLGVDNQIKLIKAGDGTPYPNAVGRDFYGDKLAVEFTLLFNSMSAGVSDPVELQNFLAYAARTTRAAFPGAPLPCGVLTAASGWPTALQQNSVGGYYGLMLDSAGTYEMASEKKVDGRTALTFKQHNEVDLVSMGVGYQVWLVSRVNPFAF